MSSRSFFRPLAVVIACLFALHAHGQYNYTMYFQSGPDTTMKASAGSFGFEVPIERVTHYFSFKYRTSAGGPINAGSTSVMGFVTTGPGGSGANPRSLLVTAPTPYGTYTYGANGTYTYTPFSAVEWWLTDSTASQDSTHYSIPLSTTICATLRGRPPAASQTGTLRCPICAPAMGLFLAAPALATDGRQCHRAT